MSRPTIKKPGGLPRPKSGPQALPSVKSEDSGSPSGIDEAVRNARICPSCGKEGRVVSNRLGVNVHCGPCKRHWPISNGPLRPESPACLPRGFSKQTHVEPNWSAAFDDIRSPDGS